jgi:hypothetical protein
MHRYNLFVSDRVQSRLLKTARRDGIRETELIRYHLNRWVDECERQEAREKDRDEAEVIADAVGQGDKK